MISKSELSSIDQVPLHSDLIPHAVDGMIHHPLLIQLLPADFTYINRLYSQKLEKLEQAEADCDWSKYVTLHEKPYRLNALIAATGKGLGDSPDEFWTLLSSVWRGSENIYQYQAEWRLLWRSPIEGRQACMSAEEAETFRSLPKQIEVWRGANYKNSIAGLSWTLNPRKAAWYARRFCSNHRSPFVARGYVSKRDVFAYFGGRDGNEIVTTQVSVISVCAVDVE